MNWNKKKKFCIQASIALLILCSTGVSAIHETNPSVTTISRYVSSTFYQDEPPAMTVTITPPAVVFGQKNLMGQEFATLELPEEGFTTTVGDAQLPLFSRYLEIPFGAHPEVIIESVSWQTTSLAALHLPSMITPVQPSLLKVEGATVEFSMDSSYYSVNTFLPTTVASIENIGGLRERNIALITISPVQYNPVSGELRLMTHCELRINLPESDLTQTTKLIDRYTTPSYEQLMGTLCVNNGQFQGTEKDEPLQEGYLIIVADSYFDAIQPFADWKETKGFSVNVTKTSQIPSGSTKENIKAYIVNAYNTWTIPPAYVLLVGDVAQVPSWTGSETGTCTDLYYATIDGGNYFADVIIGRFPAATVDQVTTMVEKTLFYEQGEFTNESWILKAAFLASTDNHLVSEGSHNYVIDTYLNPHNYTCDKLYSYYGANTAQVSAAINNGRSLVIYSGHGSETSWADGPPFSQSNINALTNDQMYPFVCSHACLTNQFTVNECFGETWLRASHKGGLAFWGASDYSYWDEDDILERRMFKAWWEDNIETIGGMTNVALYYLYQYYSGGGLSLYYLEEYNLLGDSSVVLWHGQASGNTPPNVPQTPSGPTTGEVGIEYTFSTSTTDLQGDAVFYMVSWGDTISEWLGPYTSGETVEFSHTWSVVGTYNVSVKAKDTEGLESDWSEPTVIQILAAPRIEIGNISTSFGRIAVEIKNVGSAKASNVSWSVILDGGLVLMGRNNSGTLASIFPGFAPKVTTGFVFGLGSVDVSITANEGEKTVTALLIGPFFLNVR